ncbi:hypothetical protein EDD75_0410 [Thermodesulfitimonas autotrophica]|uniref:Uncharacterized protein n=1 Tax=Thermodesulfitimonas autotrophica TaxID=1894989 RepID=A0A3N5BPQ0_9THEO|nr:hypothetical protein [Thermodesulfitimonas autotrophica]RPF49592.1 hypothetical protein EDD75_0410 [Thermodesulfitimonas autotrophica]
MDFFNDIFKFVAQGKEFAEVFTPEVVDKLAELDEKDYDLFKVQLDAHLILNQIEMEEIKNLDKLVRAARARLEEKRSKLPLAPVREQLPDAPDELVFVPPGWLLAPDGVYQTDAEGAPKRRVCTSPFYVSRKRLDPDRRKTYITLTLKVKEWRTTMVPASSPVRKVVAAVAEMGALVLDDKAFSRYWGDLLKTNWDALPVVEADCALYDELMAFVADNMDKISEAGPWGKLVDGKDSYLALKPEIVKKFAGSAGVDYEHLLLSLKKNGLLLSDADSRLKTVWFGGRARRMVAVMWDRQASAQRSVCGA